MPKDYRKKRAQIYICSFEGIFKLLVLQEWICEGRGFVIFLYDMILYYIDTSGNVWVWDGCQTIYIKLFCFLCNQINKGCNKILIKTLVHIKDCTA